MISDSCISKLWVNLIFEKAAISMMPRHDRGALLQHRRYKSHRSFIARMARRFPMAERPLLGLAGRRTPLGWVYCTSPVENEHRLSCNTGCEL